VARYDWYPMIRGRLLAVNGQPVGPDSYAEDRAKRLVDREFNLSNAVEAPGHNQVVAGQWTPGEEGAISVEEGIAQTLGLQLGDRLQFDMGGVQNEARITSLRKVDWGSMRANFFVMYPVASLKDVPVTYLAAYRAPDKAGFDNALVRQFPNITNVDMGATIAQARGLPALSGYADQLAQALQDVTAATQAAWSTGNPNEALANAVPYMQAFGHMVLAWMWLDVACKVRAQDATLSIAANAGRMGAARYFYHYELPKIGAWLKVVESRDLTCADCPEEAF
jgi:hypothetical protein